MTDKVHPDYYGKSCRVCGIELTPNNTLLHSAKGGSRICHECNKIYQRMFNQKLKKLLFRRMGEKCIKCGFSDHRALQIDHIKSDAKGISRKSGPRWYKHLLGLSDKELYYSYQLLCANCNWIKRWENKELYP